jgi:threonine/homoserine/homoserine lactone efflux protein
MEILGFVALVVGVTSSGALAPGPLSAGAITSGLRNGWKGGLLVAVGHIIFELPYIIVLAITLENISWILNISIIKYALSLAVVIILTFFAISLLNDALKQSDLGITKNPRTGISNPLLIGLAFTALNPYFLLWWASVGMELIRRALAFGLLPGIIILYLSHFWMDVAWLTGLGLAANRGVERLGGFGYKVLLEALALVLMVFALHIFALTFFNIRILPI